jgi:4,5-DOPA dioxygenase extradiol
MGEDARLSAPTPDHFLPLLYAMGASDESDEVSFPVDGIDGGSVSMLSVLWSRTTGP